MAHRGKGQETVSPRSTFAIMLAAAFYLIAAYIGFFRPDMGETVISMLVAAATAMVAVGLYRAWMEKKGEPLVDERTKLVQRIAVNYSWWFSYVVIAALMLVNQFKLAVLNVESVLSLVFFTMISSLMLARFWISRKGDLE